MVGHSIGNHTGIITNVRFFHFGNIQISSLLRNKAAVILIGRVFIEDPGVAQLCKDKSHRCEYGFDPGTLLHLEQK